MERSTVQLLAKRGKSQRAIARELGISRITVARVLEEPVDRQPASRHRSSTVDPYRAKIEQWLQDGISIVRMYEMARADEVQPFVGGRSTFSDRVRQIRAELAREQADVPMRFEGLPGEYLQVDWGEVRRFPFTQQEPATRYVLCCRLKYSRWSWIAWTSDMRQETLLRGLIDCFLALGFVPWVLVFDNMKTVTTGRDAESAPVWHPIFRQVTTEFGFHPEACAVRRGNQKGSVESLVKWVKGNFLAGRTFADDADLTRQAAEWVQMANTRVSDATGTPPEDRLPEEAARGGVLPAAARDYGFLRTTTVTAESLIHLAGNRYSVPVERVGTTLTARLYRTQVGIFHNTDEVARHRRAPDGAQRRVINPLHFQSLFTKKPRAQVMLYRQQLLELSPEAGQYMAEVSYRRRERLRGEILATYALFVLHGRDALVEVMGQADARGIYGAEYLEAILAAVPTSRTLQPAISVDLPSQDQVDRRLEQYEAFVTVSAGASSW
ncbi:MAG: IS21 family transposase [Chloroflexi bacterium]|nr:IS21 family transposase [Chloroflexota bacterium]